MGQRIKGRDVKAAGHNHQVRAEVPQCGNKDTSRHLRIGLMPTARRQGEY